ncbi:MAG: nucleotide sugar dehydrogenase [Thalassobaculales bacterium]
MFASPIAVIGVGYVGLPLAVALARAGAAVIAYDRDAGRIAELAAGHDRTGEEPAPAVPGLAYTADPAALAAAGTFIVAVPTPVDADRRPDLGPLRAACEVVGTALRGRPGGLVVFESTVYPGVTEEVCGPLIAAAAGLVQGSGFHLGYSPERINPGDRAHGLDRVVKIVAAQDAATLERVAALYAPVVSAGLHRAPSIRVAEAAKVAENIQRDVNIALVNELSRIFDALDIETRAVLAAMRTKWNALPFSPGLVGGHCIGVDPYYLIAKAEAHGYYPELIRAARRLNDGMAAHVAQRAVRLLAAADRPLADCRVAILGITFKEDVSDIRNSQVPEIARHLAGFGVAAAIHDPLADAGRVAEEYGVTLAGWPAEGSLDLLVLAVPHAAFRAQGAGLGRLLRPGGALIDVRSALDPARLAGGLRYWAL